MKKLIQKIALAGTIALATIGSYTLGHNLGYREGEYEGVRQGFKEGREEFSLELNSAFCYEAFLKFNSAANNIKTERPAEPKEFYQETFNPTQFISKVKTSGNMEARDEVIVGKAYMDSAKYSRFCGKISVGYIGRDSPEIESKENQINRQFTK